MRHVRAYPTILTIILSTAALAASAQEPTQNVVDPIVFHLSGGQNAPLKLVRLMIGQTEVPLDSPVRVDGMWMQKLQFIVQNVSSKTIVKAGLTVLFPETIAEGTSQPVPSLTMSVGKLPKHAYMRKDGTILGRPTSAQSSVSPQISQDLQITPGASITFIPYPGANLVQARAYSIAGRLTKVNITFDPAYFEDESKWIAGKYYLAAPAPELWQLASPAEFGVAADDKR